MPVEEQASHAQGDPSVGVSPAGAGKYCSQWRCTDSVLDVAAQLRDLPAPGLRLGRQVAPVVTTSTAKGSGHLAC